MNRKTDKLRVDLSDYFCFYKKINQMKIKQHYHTSPCPFLAKYSFSSTSTSLMMLEGTGGPTWPAAE